MILRWIAVTSLTLWVSGMFALAFGSRAYEAWRGPDDSVIVPITVKAVPIAKPPETVVEKTQERVEAPPIRPAVVATEEPPPAAVPATPAPAPKPKRRKIVKKAPAPVQVLVGGQPL